VDVLFKEVKSMHLPTLMNELHVEEADATETLELASNLGEWQLLDSKVFLVRGADFHGHVVSGGAVVAEDTGEFDAPSPFEGPSLVEMWRDREGSAQPPPP
jgi:hypothetical protein